VSTAVALVLTSRCGGTTVHAPLLSAPKTLSGAPTS